ncbi:MAG: hypothetical protein WCP34_15995, partial [Pseudomonadota bacterium]
FLDTVGAAYLFDGWRKAMPRNGEAWPFRFKALTAFVLLIFTTGLGILVPFTVSRVAHMTMALTLGANGIWLWGLAVNLAPLLLIGGVSTGQAIVKVTEQAGQMTGQEPAKTGQMTGQKSEMIGRVSEYPTDWRMVRKLLTAEQLEALSSMATGEICYRYGLPERQARRWREKAAEEIKTMVEA